MRVDLLDQEFQRMSAKNTKLAGIISEANVENFDYENLGEAKCKEIAEDLKDKEITIKVKTGEQDKVFGTVSSKQICEELKKIGYDIDKKKIVLDHAIDSLGTHNVEINLHKKVKGVIKVTLKK